MVVPRRGRVLAAKSLVLAAVTFVVGEVASFGAFFVGGCCSTAGTHD
jgi:hypothetical protein